MAERGKGPPLDPDRFRAIFLLLLVLGISLLFLEMIRSFFVTLFLGAIFSGMLHPVYRRVLGWCRGRTGVASFLTLVLFFFLLLGPAATFLGIVADQAVQVTESAGPWIRSVQEQLDQPGAFDRLIDSLPFAETLRPYQEQVTRRVGELAGSVGGWVVQGLTDVTTGAVRVIFLLFVMLYAMFFFLMDGSGVLRKILYYLPLSNEDEHRMLEKFVSVTRAMVKGTFLIGVVQGALAGIAFAIAGIPSAAFWGTVMAVLSIVPGVGSALVWVPAAVYLAVIDRMGAAIGLVAWCGVVVGLVDNLMRPWLVGRDTKMPDLMILLGTLGGLFAFGAAGVLIGPIIAALFITVWELYGEAFRDVLPEAELPETPIRSRDDATDDAGRDEAEPEPPAPT
ncbi:MAG: AI-2E family transporter [Gemmatimonadetes bacterium]|nr:AI-2E family transporter [Gemmatimonadota bacterium]